MNSFISSNSSHFFFITLNKYSNFDSLHRIVFLQIQKKANQLSILYRIEFEFF